MGNLGWGSIAGKTVFFPEKTWLLGSIAGKTRLFPGNTEQNSVFSSLFAGKTGFFSGNTGSIAGKTGLLGDGSFTGLPLGRPEIRPWRSPSHPTPPDPGAGIQSC